jgi:hypothetical protein
VPDEYQGEMRIFSTIHLLLLIQVESKLSIISIEFTSPIRPPNLPDNQGVEQGGNRPDAAMLHARLGLIHAIGNVVGLGPRPSARFDPGAVHGCRTGLQSPVIADELARIEGMVEQLRAAKEG